MHLFILFSDGFADQFGGSEETKYLKSNFKSLLLQASKMPIKVQRDFLKNAFDKWKGNHEQVDDVLVVGFKTN